MKIITHSNIINRQIYFLRLLSAVPKNDIKVMVRPQSPWIPLFDVMQTQPCKPIHARTILRNEIVMEMDNDNWEVVRDGTRRILSVLHKWGADGSYYLSFSGNRSIHVHVFFDRSLMVYPEVGEILKGKDGVISAVKHYLMSQIATASDTVIDMQLSGNHMIRMEGGFNEKSHRFCTAIDTIPDEKPQYYEITVPDALPSVLWDLTQFEKEINTFLRIHYGKAPHIEYRGTGRPFDPEPLKDTLKPVFIPGYRHYIVLALSGWLKRHSIPEDRAMEIVRGLNPDDKTPGKTSGTVKEVYSATANTKIPGLPRLTEIVAGQARDGVISGDTAEDVIQTLKQLNRGHVLREASQ